MTHDYAAARAKAIATYPAHVIEAGGPDHYAAGLAQQLHDSILRADWAAVRRIASDPHAAGDDVDMAKGALAGAGVNDQPPSTVTELRQVLIDFEAQRPRSLQKALGPSELGTPCQQQIARKLAGAPRRPITEPTWAPFQGTAVHASMEDVVAFWNGQLGRERWLAEDRLVVDPGPGHYPAIEGNGDAFDQDHAMVVDWKHVGTSALKKLRTAKRMGKPAKEQISAEYRAQAHLYGLGHQNKGRDVKHVRVVMLARSWQYDDSDEWTEAYNPDIAHWYLGRYWRVVDQLAAAGLDAVPAAPSNDACHWCPFHRPGQVSDIDGCRGHETEADRPVTDWLATLPSPGATTAPAK
jgi:hypothetical protein